MSNRLRSVGGAWYNVVGLITGVETMFTDARQELLSFHHFVAEQLKAGDDCVSPAEALELWRLQNRTPEEFEVDVQAIREALDDLDAGNLGTPLEVFRAEFRKQHHLDNEA